MVFTCCVPNCKGNYPGTKKVQCFSFPTESRMKQKWLNAIRRKNFVPSKYSKVCELHFAEENIRQVTECFDECGKKISVHLSRYQLKKCAVPTIFPNCSKYLSVSTQFRESPEERRKRLENEHINYAVTESLSSNEAYLKTVKFSSISSLNNILKNKLLPDSWIYVFNDENVIFLKMQYVPAPDVIASVVINQNLELSAYVKTTAIQKMGNFVFPKSVDDINNILNVLEALSFTGNDKDCLKIICEFIQSLIDECNEKMQTKLKFILDQLKLMCVSKEQFRYAPDSIVLFSLLYTISPHAYRFLRRTDHISLPHPRTIQRLCSTLPTNPVNEENSFSHLRKKAEYLKPADRIVFIMMDEIYIKPYLDYKAGNLVGMAHNAETLATTAHVFMIQSLLSAYKEVVQIIPAKNIRAEDLHKLILNCIMNLEKLNFFVVAVVSDNNSINKKAMSHFLIPPQISIVYPHPSNNERPLFYVIDSVHILKSIRNNWLCQKNSEQAFYFPHFDNFSNVSLLTASFQTLRKLYEIESKNLVKYAYGLNLKALCPSNLEKQNVKLVLNIFNEYVIQGLYNLGKEHNISNYDTTAIFLNLIYKWWCIMNVKTPFKGKRFRDEFQLPLVKEEDENFTFLYKFLAWLDYWKEQKQDTGTLTRETHMALSHTTHSIIEMAKYCLTELKFDYFLPGKVQTDALEDRFGKYRSLAGSVYLISMRQIYEAEAKLRLQNFLPLTLQSSSYGIIRTEISDIPLDNTFNPLELNKPEDFNVNISKKDLENIQDLLPVLIYLSGYCSRAALKLLDCISCSNLLITDKTLIVDPSYSLIQSMDRGGLLYPQIEIINVVVYTYLTFEKLISAENENKFLACKNQRQTVMHFALHNIHCNELYISDCTEGHSSKMVVRYVIQAATNILLKNYCRKINDIPKSNHKKRKLRTVQQS